MCIPFSNSRRRWHSRAASSSIELIIWRAPGGPLGPLLSTPSSVDFRFFYCFVEKMHFLLFTFPLLDFRFRYSTSPLHKLQIALSCILPCNAPLRLCPRIDQELTITLQTDASGAIIELGCDPSDECSVRVCPWKEHLVDVEEAADMHGSILYVIYPDNSPGAGLNWRVQAVPLRPHSFESRFLRLHLLSLASTFCTCYSVLLIFR